MSTVPWQNRAIRLAVLTHSISHFEAPLFRLLAARSDLALRVFYMHESKRERYDSQYSQVISWGTDVFGGFESECLPSAAEMQSAAEDWGADVILMYGYGWAGAPTLILRNWLLRVPQIHRGTLNYHLDPRRPILGRMLRPIRGMLLRLFDSHHFGGDYSRQVLLQAGIEPEALFFVPFSVDSEYFLAQSAASECRDAARRLRDRLGWQEDHHVVLFIAQHNWFKGPDIAMATFAEVAAADSKARFLVVGSGSMTEEMKLAASQFIPPGCIHFAGFIPSLETVPYYLASDLVLCPSRYETWARMTNEAMLCGRPCLASRLVPACGGLIEHGVNGLVVDTPEPAALALAVREYFSLGADVRRSMGIAARRRAMDFAYELHVENAVMAVRHALLRRTARVDSVS